jgi:hypothetical protein
VYEIDPASGRVQQQVDFDDRCAGNRLIDDAATFGTSDRSTLFWIDQSCDGERGLGGREGAHLMTPGTDG